jgi:hypothetical protein
VPRYLPIYVLGRGKGRGVVGKVRGGSSPEETGKHWENSNYVMVLVQGPGLVRNGDIEVAVGEDEGMGGVVMGIEEWRLQGQEERRMGTWRDERWKDGGMG